MDRGQCRCASLPRSGKFKPGIRTRGEEYKRLGVGFFMSYRPKSASNRHVIRTSDAWIYAVMGRPAFGVSLRRQQRPVSH